MRNNKIISREAYVNLDRILRPLWCISYISGILPTDFRCCGKKSPVKTALSYLAVCFTFTAFVSLNLFIFYQIVIDLKRASGVHSVISFSIWLFPMLIAAFSQFYYVIRRQAISLFLKDWRVFEQVLHIRSCINGKTHLKFYLFYFVMTTASVIFVGYQVYKNPGEQVFISSYEVVVEKLSLIPIVAFYVYTTFLVWISVSLSECVPGFIFLSAALAVNSLSKEVETVLQKKSFGAVEKYAVDSGISQHHLVKNNGLFLLDQSKNSSILVDEASQALTKIRGIWIKFKRIKQLVDRANYLFGAPLLLNQGISVFMMCSLLYSIFSYLPQTFLDDKALTIVMNYTVNVIVITIRFICVSWLACRLSTISEQFQSSLGFIVGENWASLESEQRDYLVALLDTITRTKLAASPCELYSITNSFYLATLGVVLSYVVVLLQT